MKMYWKKADMVKRILEVCEDGLRVSADRQSLITRCKTELLDGTIKTNAKKLVDSLQVRSCGYDSQMLESRTKFELMHLFTRMISNIDDIIVLNRCLRVICRDECDEWECTQSLNGADWHGNSCKDCNASGCDDYTIANCRLSGTCNYCFDDWMKRYPGMTCKDVYDLEHPDIQEQSLDDVNRSLDS